MAWYNASWSGRFPITSQNAKVAEAVDNGYYDLSLAPAGFHAAVKTGGVDIRVARSDGDTEVAREVVVYDEGADTGELHFDTTGIQTGSDIVWYIYAGNPAASDYAVDDTYGAEAVWNANYLGVWHLHESSGSALDSTSNSNDAAFVGNLPNSVPVKIGNGQDLNGTGDRMLVANRIALSTGATLECWIEPDVLKSEAMMAKRDGASDNNWQFYVGDASGGLTVIFWGLSPINHSPGDFVTTGLSNFIATYNGSVVKIYKDASEIYSFATTGTIIETDIDTRFGSDWFGGDFDGGFDEFRISNIARSADWITTGYNNQDDPSTFWSTGAWENNIVIGPIQTGRSIGDQQWE